MSFVFRAILINFLVMTVIFGGVVCVPLGPNPIKDTDKYVFVPLIRDPFGVIGQNYYGKRSKETSSEASTQRTC